MNDDARGTPPGRPVRPQGPRLHAALSLVLTLALPGATWADGGLVRVSRAAGPFTVSVFTSPTPLRAGPIDVSVLVQRLGDGAVVDDAAVTLTLRARDGVAPPVSGPATRAQATNKLLYAALLELPAAGAWDVDVAVERQNTTATLSFPVAAAPPLPPWRAYWAYLALPFAGIAIYALHQRLALRAGLCT